MRNSMASVLRSAQRNSYFYYPIITLLLLSFLSCHLPHLIAVLNDNNLVFIGIYSFL